MPTEAVDVGMSDQELFDQANADEAPADDAVVEAPEAEAEQEAQPHRDEQGRFASKEEEQPAVAEQPAPPPVDDNAAMVPSWRVREINEEKRALADRLAAFEAEKRQWQQPRPAPAPQPAPVAQVEPPDPLLDPAGYREFIRNELREERLNERREESLAKAHEDHGKEFEEAYAAAQQVVDPALKARMQQSRDPGKTLIQWHRERKTMAEVGTDPNAFFEKRFEAYLSDPANQAKVLERIRGGVQPQQNAAARQAAPVNLPPSLTRATNASANTSADDNDISNEGLWRHANG